MFIKWDNSVFGSTYQRIINFACQKNFVFAGVVEI